MEAATRSRIATGLTLIVLGLGLYGLQYLGETGRPLLLMLIGGLSLAGYFATRTYLLLVVGAIVAGFGVGLFGEERWFVVHDYTELGLGAGFLAIYLIRLAYERHSHWWPLVPAVICFLLGFHAWGDFRRLVFSSRGWPILIAILGALILLGAVGGRKRGRK